MFYFLILHKISVQTYYNLYKQHNNHFLFKNGTTFLSQVNNQVKTFLRRLLYIQMSLPIQSYIKRCLEDSVEELIEYEVPKQYWSELANKEDHLDLISLIKYFYYKLSGDKIYHINEYKNGTIQLQPKSMYLLKKTKINFPWLHQKVYHQRTQICLLILMGTHQRTQICPLIIMGTHWSHPILMGTHQRT